MNAAHLEDLIVLEESYWWHVAKRNLVSRLLTRYFPAPGRLVEGGIGSGRNLQHFRQLGYDVMGLDISDVAVRHARERGLDNVVRHDLADAWPVEDETLHAVVLLDVLEHLSTPVQALREVACKLSPAGGVIVTVPAMPWLFGEWDQMLGHYRRYTAGLLRQHATEAALRVVRLGYWNSFSLPAAVVLRGWKRLIPSHSPSATFPRVSPSMNSLLLKCAEVERRGVESGWLPPLWGLSLYAVLTR